MRMFFVTPAWQRFDLTAVCFEQRRRVIEELARHGIEAHCVVVADDENLDIARGVDFDVVEQRNNGPDGKPWLGRKFNDGYEYAGRHGADYLVAIGSDSWIDPAYFLNLPNRSITRTAVEYCVVKPDHLATLCIDNTPGVGPYVFHRRLLAPSGFRPAEDNIPRHVDSSTLAGIVRTTGRLIHFQRHSLHPFQYVGFRQAPLLTPYDRLWTRWGVDEFADPWARLAEHYPADLVEAARRALSVAIAA